MNFKLKKTAREARRGRVARTRRLFGDSSCASARRRFGGVVGVRHRGGAMRQIAELFVRADFTRRAGIRSKGSAGKSTTGDRIKGNLSNIHTIVLKIYEAVSAAVLVSIAARCELAIDSSTSPINSS